MLENNLKKYTIWLFIAAVILILAGIGLRDPWPPDEPRFALMAKEMWETGNWFFPHRGGEIYPDKPPMVMWMMLLFYAVIGNLKIAFLLPSAILSMLTLWLTYDLTRRLWDAKTAFYAAFLLTCSLHFILQAKSGQLDAPVAFWVMLGSYGMLRHLILGPQWRWYYLSWFAMGMGVITKGVGFLPALFLLALIKYPPAWQDKENKQWLKWLIGPLFLLFAVSLWLIPMLIQVHNHPTTEVLAYRDNILLKQTVNRYAKSWAHIKPFWHYILIVIPIFWIPVSLFIPWLIKPFRKAFQEKQYRVIYPLLWVVLCVFFFSLSKGKRAEYMLPMLPIFVLAVAPYFEKLIGKKGVQRLLIGFVLVISSLLFIIGASGWLELEKITKLTEKYSVNPWYWMTTLGLAGLILFLWLRKSAMTLYASFIGLLWLSYSLWILPIADKAMSMETAMKALNKIIPNQTELAIVGFREKILLHSKWSTTHFGRNTPVQQQTQAAINWSKKHSNSFILVHHQYLSDCFENSESIAYDSFHSQKWLLFSSAQLNPKHCQSDNEVYSQYSKKGN